MSGLPLRSRGFMDGKKLEREIDTNARLSCVQGFFERGCLASARYYTYVFRSSRDAGLWKVIVDVNGLLLR